MKDLYKEYGYCIVPKGTSLFRTGEINQQSGSFYALHPTCAISFNNDENSNTPIEYITLKNLKLLFLIKELNSFGMPQNSLVELYSKYIEPIDENSDLEIKNKIILREKLLNFLRNDNIAGFLTTQENNFPLELFLLNNSVCKMSIFNRIDSNIENSLKKIDIFPNSNFINSSLKNLKQTLDFLKTNESINSENYYSIVNKLFF